MILKMSNKLIAVILLSSRKTLSREVLSFIAKLAKVRTGSKGWQAVSSTHLLRIPKIKLSAQKQDFQCSTQVRNITNQRWANFPYWHRQPRPCGRSLLFKKIRNKNDWPFVCVVSFTFRSLLEPFQFITYFVYAGCPPRALPGTSPVLRARGWGFL